MSLSPPRQPLLKNREENRSALRGPDEAAVRSPKGVESIANFKEKGYSFQKLQSVIGQGNIQMTF